MIEKVTYPMGNGVVRSVKRAKNQIRHEKLRAAKFDAGVGGAAGVLTYLACKAMEISPMFAPALAVLLTPIIGKNFFDRYKDVAEAKKEYNELKESPEYQRILKRQDYMHKRKLLSHKGMFSLKA